MKTQSLLIAATLFATVGMASAQNEPSQDTMRAPTGVESTAPNNPPVATVRRPLRTRPVRPNHRPADRLLTSPRDGSGNGQCRGQEASPDGE